MYNALIDVAIMGVFLLSLAAVIRLTRPKPTRYHMIDQKRRFIK